MSSKLKQLLRNNERYKDYYFLTKPCRFDELFGDQDFDAVQLHWVRPISFPDGDDCDIVGYCGAFEWRGGEAIPLDGDDYSPHVLIYGYQYFEFNDKDGLDILVGDDW